MQNSMNKVSKSFPKNYPKPLQHLSKNLSKIDPTTSPKPIQKPLLFGGNSSWHRLAKVGLTYLPRFGCFQLAVTLCCFQLAVAFLPWHRLRISPDIGFAFVLTSASLHLILTSASRSSWHRLRIIWNLPQIVIESSNKIMPTGLPKSFKELSKITAICSWHRLRIIWKLYWRNIKNSNKIMPIWPPTSFKNYSKSSQKLLELLPNLFRNPFQHDMQSNMKNISKLYQKTSLKPLQNRSKNLLKIDIKIIKKSLQKPIQKPLQKPLQKQRFLGPPKIKKNL